MVAERAAPEAGIAFAKGFAPAPAQFGNALPGECPDGGEGDVRRIEGGDIPEGFPGEKFLHAVHDRVVVHLQLDLEHDAGLRYDFHHLVVFRHVEGRNLHGQDVDAPPRAVLDLLQVAAVRGSDDDSLDFRMGVEHLVV